MTINFNSKVRFNRLYRSSGNIDNALIFDPDNIKPASLSSFESDRGRIINSAAIRRLQQKTQVFPLERNSAVRSRLTHSMEVQQVGRYIVQEVFRLLDKQEKEHYHLDQLERQFESIVEMSCLMHDVGNPPFGHFGEQAINCWFKKQLHTLIATNTAEAKIELPEPLYRDLSNFEGNAQAIRLVHTLLELNLTFSQVSGILKYTRRADQLSPKELKKQNPNYNDELSYLKKKVGYYVSEDDYVSRLRTCLSMEEGCRSPFSYIMEAADDISYGIADIEDTVEKNIIDPSHLEKILIDEYSNLLAKYKNAAANEMKDIVKLASESAHRANNCATSHFFITLRMEINKRVPNYAANQFIENIDAIYHGRFNRALIEDESTEHALVQTLKNIAVKYAICAPEVDARKLQGYRIITGLLDIYKPLIELDNETFTQIVEGEEDTPLYETRLFNKLPSKHLRAYTNALKEEAIANLPYDFTPDVWEFYFRVRLIQDYISGMTDQFAFDEYRALMVIDPS
ncbi:dGTPase [Vibrio sp. F74]|uniref:dGTPase n=1 Tax=Vibrio sp. F74 TaxID=700020 RepID=UPI0035F5F055